MIDLHLFIKLLVCQVQVSKAICASDYSFNYLNLFKF